MALTPYLLLACFLVYSLYKLVTPFLGSLASIPGPVLARFTQLWAYRRFCLGRWHHEIIALHQQHGPIVRYAPGHYSISDPAAIKTIAGHGGDFDKSAFYETWSPPGTTSLFKEQNNTFHGGLRKRFSAMYSMTSAYSYEAGIEQCINLLCERLQERAGQRIDVAWWLECLAFDCIGVATYGKRLGFLDEGQDVQNLQRAVVGAFGYASKMGILSPEMHAPFQKASKFLKKYGIWSGTGKMFIDQFTGETTIQRRKERAAIDPLTKTDTNTATSILDKFLSANETDPTYFTDAHISLGLGANVTAGSDTTSSTMTVVLYYLLRSPQTVQKLREEIASVAVDAQVKLKDAIQIMPYLNAIITETLRLFPQTGFGLPRVVPAGGAHICGHDFPSGSVVSLNAWAMHYDKNNFEEPETFKPERWLNDCEGVNNPQAYFPFGLGSRTCIGKNIAMLVMLKTLTVLVTKFDFEFVNEEEALKIENIFLVRVKEFMAVARERK